MTIRVNSELTKTRNPVEHGYTLEKEHGDIIQNLDDGYSLIRFNKLKIKKQVKIDKKTRWIITPLEWYVHRNDFNKI